MKRPLYYLLCAIACTSMVGATMPMAAIAEAIQPPATAEQQAQADTTSSDTGKAEDGTNTNATADTAEDSTASSTGTSAANTEGADGTTAATSGTTAATDTATTTPTPSLRAQATPTPKAISAASQTGYAHSAAASQNGVTFTVSWNDAPAGTATTFHVTQAGGSSQAKARMDVPTYWDGGSQESVCDPSRQAWAGYHSLGAAGHDFTFDFTASGTYRIYFYFMDNDRNDPQNDKGIYYLRTMAEVTVDDAARPSVTQIVNDAVDLCRQETSGSEYDMALWLHDWTLDQLGYDHSLNWCSAESGLTRHQGTCESYQRIYSKLLNAAGIANGRITGNGHTWNAVKIDGKWCQMDLTWDDTSDNWYGDLDQRHLYFGLTDELMAIAHSDHTANYQKDDYAYRSTDLSNNYFVRNGKADKWAEKYADRIQQHLDAKEESFSIDADNQSFPPSISGIQNGIVAYAMNLREWKAGDAKVELAATSNVTIIDVYHWAVSYEFKASHQRPAHSAPLADGDYRLLSPDGSLGVGAGPAAAVSGAASALSFERDAGSGSYTITDKSSGKALTARALELNGPVTMEEPDGSAAQLWDVTANGDGTLRIQPASDHSLTADMCGAWSRGSRMLLWARGQGENQRFVARAVAPLADGDYRLLSPDGSLGVGAGPAAAVSGAASALSFERDAGSGSYTITDKSSGKALTARALELNGPVTMEEPDGSAAQLWDVTANGDGTLRIQPASDHSLTADMCGAWSRGSRMLLWARGQGENQRFVARAVAPLADGDYRLLSPDGSLGVGAGPAAAVSGAASALSFERDAGSGSYTITDKSSGKALTARALELNGPVTMEEPDGSAAQLWDVTANGDGTLRIQPASDHSLTADMCGAWSRGSRMLLWARGQGENQRFVARAVAPLADGDYRLLSPDGSLGVGAGPAAAVSGAASALSFERDAGSGSYTITDKSSGKALTARALELNGPVTMEEPDGSAAQLWDVTANGDGTLRIQPASDHSLTADMCGAWSRGSRMLLWARGQGENQRFVARAVAPLADGDYRLLSPDGSLGVGAGPAAAVSGAASALSFERDAGSGSYTITDKSSGKALTARALELNGPVTMEEPDGSAAQLWDVTANGDGTLRIQPASDHSLTADMCGAWSRGSRMLLWARGQGENQRFVARAVAPLADGDYRLLSPDGSLGVGAGPAAAVSGAASALSFERDAGSGSYTITDKSSGKALTARALELNGPVTMEEPDGSAAQLWDVTANGDGTLRIQPASDHSLTADMCGAWSRGSRMLLWARGQGENQRFVARAEMT